jgi:hypothetical protein
MMKLADTGFGFQKRRSVRYGTNMTYSLPRWGAYSRRLRRTSGTGFSFNRFAKSEVSLGHRRVLFALLDEQQNAVNASHEAARENRGIKPHQAPHMPFILVITP